MKGAEMLKLRSFLGDSTAAMAVEFALVSLLVMGLILGTIDFARYAWEINCAKDAARAGVRKAVVLSPVAATLNNYDATGTYGSGVWVPIDATGVGPFECTFVSGAVNCGSSGHIDASFDKIYQIMHSYYSRIQRQNISVRYEHIGIGISGNPCAPDVEPMVTVKVSGLTFSPIALRLFGINNLPIPSSTSSMTGESLGQSSCS